MSRRNPSLLEVMRRAVDVHEPLTRARGGNITDPSNALLVCRGHHDAVHANPAEASRRGLLTSRRPA